jgi:hypothetical protein
MEPGEVGDLLNFLRTNDFHDMADWVAKTTVKGRSIEEQIWIDRGCPEDG